jgi:hypothetical protein
MFYCFMSLFYWMFYLEIISTLVILWPIFIPLKINNAMNNIYQSVLISCVILSLSSWPLIPLTTIPKSEKIRFPKRVWSQGFRIRDCVPVEFTGLKEWRSGHSWVRNFWNCFRLHLESLLLRQVKTIKVFWVVTTSSLLFDANILEERIASILRVT